MGEIEKGLEFLFGFVLEILLGIGREEEALTFWQMSLRAVVVYVVTVVMVRLAKKRFMGKATAFDVILGIMLGSIVSRTVTGNAPFVPTLTAAATLLLMHWLFSGIAMRSHRFGKLVKGRNTLLVRNGEVDSRAMRRSHLSERDLMEDLRAKGVSRLDDVAEARLERNGEISVIKAGSKAQIVEVSVAEGVQTVRVELG